MLAAFHLCLTGSYTSEASTPRLNLAELDPQCLQCVVGLQKPCRSVAHHQPLQCLERSISGGKEACPPSTCDCMNLACGHTKQQKGEALCAECTRGKFGVSIGGDVSCVFCPQGKFSTAHNGNCKCLSCPTNYFQPLFGKSRCQHCPAGYSSESLAASSFCQGSKTVTCFPGTFAYAGNTRFCNITYLHNLNGTVPFISSLPLRMQVQAVPRRQI